MISNGRSNRNAGTIPTVVSSRCICPYQNLNCLPVPASSTLNQNNPSVGAPSSRFHAVLSISVHRECQEIQTACRRRDSCSRDNPEAAVIPGLSLRTRPETGGAPGPRPVQSHLLLQPPP